MSLMEKVQKRFGEFLQSIAEEESKETPETGKTNAVEAPKEPEEPKAPEAPAQTPAVEAPKENAPAEEPKAPEAPADDDAEKVNALKAEAAEEERARLQAIDDIAGSIDDDLVKEAKYGETACDAKELAMRQLMRETQKSQTALSDLNADGKDGKTNSVTSLPPAQTKKVNKDEERKLAVAALREKINKIKGGK